MNVFRKYAIAAVFTVASSRGADAQLASDGGALAMLAGTDTVVLDRFVRSADTLRGSVVIKGQARIEYLALLGPDEAVRALSIAAFAESASPGSAPMQRARIAIQGDSAIAETAAGRSRIGTKGGAIPMFNNALALSELFTRRAKTTGGIADIPYFSIANGATIIATVRPVGPDSATLTIGAQVERLRVDNVGRIVSGTVSGTPLTLVRLGAAAANGMVTTLRDSSIAPQSDYSVSSSSPYSAEEVRVAGPSGMLAGTFTRPKGGARVPAVVTITGSGQQDRDEYIASAGGVRLFRQVADTLGRRGIAVLRLDDRGIGESGGYSQNQTTADFADDIRAAISYLRSRKDVDPDRIALVGHSEGGLIAPMVAATDPRLKAIVVMAGPGERPIEISMAQNKWIVDHDTTLTPAKRDSLLRSARASLDPAKQGNAWLKFWMGYDPAPVARKVKTPVLILHGETDRQVPADQAGKLARLIRAGGNRDVTVTLIPLTNHLFIPDSSGDFNKYDSLKTNRVGAEVLGPLADWLAIKLRSLR
jgi:dienelactone hydrolase